jgi:hypothetical protein
MGSRRLTTWAMTRSFPKCKVKNFQGNLPSLEGVRLQWSRNVTYILKQKDQEMSSPIFLPTKALNSLMTTDYEGSADEECIYCSLPYRLDKLGDNWIRCTWCPNGVFLLCADPCVRLLHSLSSRIYIVTQYCFRYVRTHIDLDLSSEFCDYFAHNHVNNIFKIMIFCIKIIFTYRGSYFSWCLLIMNYVS